MSTTARSRGRLPDLGVQLHRRRSARERATARRARAPYPNGGVTETLARWMRYIACDGQVNMARIGYSPLPPNLSQEIVNSIARMQGTSPERLDPGQLLEPDVPRIAGGGRREPDRPAQWPGRGRAERWHRGGGEQPERGRRGRSRLDRRPKPRPPPAAPARRKRWVAAAPRGVMPVPSPTRDPGFRALRSRPSSPSSPSWPSLL